MMSGCEIRRSQMFLLMLVAMSSATDAVQVGMLGAGGQLEVLEELVAELSPWLPSGVQLLLNEDDQLSCQQQLQRFYSSGVRHFMNACCQPVSSVPTDTQIISASYLCPDPETPRPEDSAYAAALHYLRAHVVNKIVLIGDVPQPLLDIAVYKQFQHFKLSPQIAASAAAKAVDQTRGRLAVFAHNASILFEGIQATSESDKVIWYAPNLNLTKTNALLHALQKPNITVITTNSLCESDIQKNFADEEPEYLAERVIGHLLELMNGAQGSEPEAEKCSVELLRWLPRSRVAHPDIHAMRSSDWLLEGTLEGGPAASLKLQPFHAVLRSRVESLMEGCDRWNVQIQVRGASGSQTVQYDQDSLPEVLSVHGPGVWRFQTECHDGQLEENVCVLSGAERCRSSSSTSAHSRRRRDSNSPHNHQVYYEHVDVQHPSVASSPIQPWWRRESPNQVAWLPRRRQYRPRPSIDQKVISAITPDTFGCGGILTGCAICFIILSSLAPLTTPLGCIAPCAVAGTSTCAKVAGIIYKETVIDARHRRMSRRLLDLEHNPYQ